MAPIDVSKAVVNTDLPRVLGALMSVCLGAEKQKTARCPKLDLQHDSSGADYHSHLQVLLSLTAHRQRTKARLSHSRPIEKGQIPPVSLATHRQRTKPASSHAARLQQSSSSPTASRCPPLPQKQSHWWREPCRLLLWVSEWTGARRVVS